MDLIGNDQKEVRITTDVVNDSKPRPAPPDSQFPTEPPVFPSASEPDELWVEEQLSRMNLAQRAGQMIGSEAHVYGERLIDELSMGAFFFLGNDLEAEDVAAATERLRKHSDQPLWFFIDAEAGLGSRIRNAATFPAPMAGGAADANLVEEWGRVTAREAASLGIDVILAPTADVNTAPANPVISTRAFSDDPAHVVSLCRAFIRGARHGGALTTLKHFPGHGDSINDSHKELPIMDCDPEAIESIHLRPFAELSASGDTDLMMTGHLWFRQYYPDQPAPSTLSHYFNEEVLRGRLKFDGPLLTDAFNMDGMAKMPGDDREKAIQAIEAGNDMIIISNRNADVHAAIVNAVETGWLSEERIERSVRRILRQQSRLLAPRVGNRWRETLNHPEHRKLIRFNRVRKCCWQRCKDRARFSTVFLQTNFSLLSGKSIRRLSESCFPERSAERSANGSARLPTPLTASWSRVSTGRGYTQNRKLRRSRCWPNWRRR